MNTKALFGTSMATFKRAAALGLTGAALFALVPGCAAEDEEFASADGSDSDSDDDLDSSSDELKNETVAAGDALKTTTSVNFRSAPRVASDTKIRVLSASTRVTALGGGPSNGFYAVRVGSETGYIHGAYLARVGSSAGSSGSAVYSGPLMWEGNWSFLTSCSKYSKNGVSFACNSKPSRNFVDNGMWVAIPGSWPRSWCGDTVDVCKGSTCVAATIVDHSVNGPGGDWEGSSALIRALGGKPYWSGTCGGASSGTVSGVRITMR